jgi:hypothetical protein
LITPAYRETNSIQTYDNSAMIFNIFPICPPAKRSSYASMTYEKDFKDAS